MTDYSLEDLQRMPEQDAINLLMKAVKIKATGLVIGPDGKPKYDDPACAGKYGEVNGINS